MEPFFWMCCIAVSAPLVWLFCRYWLRYLSHGLHHYEGEDIERAWKFTATIMAAVWVISWVAVWHRHFFEHPDPKEAVPAKVQDANKREPERQ
jgi:hypothetical protein